MEEEAEEAGVAGESTMSPGMLALQNQLVTCGGVIITPMVAGMTVKRQNYNYNIYRNIAPESMLLGMPVMADIFGALFCGFTMHFIGRRLHLIFTNVLFLAPLLLFVSDVGPTVDFAAVVILHFAIRFLVITLNVYVAEVTDPRYRAFFQGLYFASYQVGNIAGNSMAAQSKMPILGGFLLTIGALVLASQSPETPYYLAMTERRDQAELIFAQLRGGEGDPDEAEEMFGKAELDAESRSLANMFTRPFYTPIVVVFFMLLANNELCYLIEPAALGLVEFYKCKPCSKFMQESSTEGTSTRFLLVNGFPILGSAIFSAVAFGGFAYRRLTFMGSILLGLSIFLTHANAKNGITLVTYSYPLCHLFSYVGAKQMTRIVPIELLPGPFRDIGFAICDLMETSFTMAETFSTHYGKQHWFYKAISNLRWVFIPLGLVFTLFFLPETRDMPLAQTEEMGNQLTVYFNFGKDQEEEMYE